MKIWLITNLVVFYLLNFSLCSYAQSLLSPDSTLKFDYYIDKSEKNVLKYSINYTGKKVILKSLMGISSWLNNVEIEKTINSTKCTEWSPVYGERSVVKDYYNQRIIVLKKTDNSYKRLWIIIRAYNQGIAFRYFFPEDAERGGSYLSIEEEFTTFSFEPDAECWFAPYAQASYMKLPLRDWPGQAERPLTLKLKNHLFVSLTEASLIDYSRMKYFIDKKDENIIRCALFGRVERIAPYATPWRVIMVAEKAIDLLQNNDIILNLNDSNRIGNTSWIKPGKIMRINELTTANAKRVIDFAAKHNIEYVHFDTKWYGNETFASSDPRKTYGAELNMKEVVTYAKSKGIGVWVYVNQRALFNYLDEILPIYKSWGISGIKFGFVWVGSQFWTTWLHNAVKKCAEYNLMVDIHDEYRPTGVSRTYPNLLTQEGIRGNEEFPDANLNTILPFTRLIAGAADYTIAYYSRRDLKTHLRFVPDNKVLNNTPAHQMALSVIFYSPLQFLYWYDDPNDIQNEPEIEFFERLQTVWDDTKILDGEIGEYVVVARKSGTKWIVGGITNNDSRNLSIPLNFLEKGKKYCLTLYNDGGAIIKTRTHVEITRRDVRFGDNQKVNLMERGGFTMVIEEKL